MDNSWLSGVRRHPKTTSHFFCYVGNAHLYQFRKNTKLYLKSALSAVSQITKESLINCVHQERMKSLLSPHSTPYFQVNYPQITLHFLSLGMAIARVRIRDNIWKCPAPWFSRTIGANSGFVVSGEFWFISNANMGFETVYGVDYRFMQQAQGILSLSEKKLNLVV